VNRSAAGVPAPEDRRVGPYLVLDRIGEGGMGVVHLAQAPDGRRVALKVLRPHVVGDEEGRERLAREVASLRQVRSRHVAEIIDADPWGELAFIVTRYVPGDSLTELVKRDGPVRGADLDHLADHLLSAVRDVHASGVLHRDVKPTNVVMEGRSPILIDFGLARLAEDPTMTATGILLGTPGYLAPELLLGDQPTLAVDVHGWAATLVFAATGSSPYGRGHTMAILDRTRRGEFTLDGVPAGLRPLLAGALAPDPRERPTTQDVAGELDRLRGHDGPTSALRVAPAPADPTAPWSAVAHEPPPSPGPRPGPTTPLTAVHDPVATPPTRVAPAPVDPELAQPPAHIARSWPPPPSPTSVQPVPVMAPVAGGPHAAPPHPAGPFMPPLTGWARARRGAMVVALVVLVAAAARLAPYPAVALVAVGAVVARANSRSRDALWRRRTVRGRTWADAPRSVIGWPWHLTATAAGSLALLLVAGLAAATTLALAVVLGLAAPTALAVSGVVLAWAAWWGPGSGRVRQGVLPLLTSLARSSTTGLLTVGLLGGAALLLWLAHEQVGTSWLPSDGPPWQGLREQLTGWVGLP
jgi:serine/threonine protein kinase